MTTTRIVRLRPTLFLLALAWSMTGLAQESSPLRIAVFDSERVLIESRAGQQLQKRLEEFQQTAAAELQAMGARAMDLQTRTANGAGSLPETEIAELRRQAEEVMGNVGRRNEELVREGDRIRNEGLKTIEAQLLPVFEEIQSERQYDIIFDQGNSGIAQVSDRVDITGEIVRRLDDRSQD